MYSHAVIFYVFKLTTVSPMTRFFEKKSRPNHSKWPKSCQKCCFFGSAQATLWFGPKIAVKSCPNGNKKPNQTTL